MGEELEIPSPEEQKEILGRKLIKSLECGETWFLVSNKWLKALKQFIGLAKPGASHISPPGPIDNRPILSEDRRELRKGLAEPFEYDLVSEECWNLLYSWYGQYPGQEPIPRKAILCGVNYVMVEVYPIHLKCIKNFEMGSDVVLQVSRADKMTSIHDKLRKQFSISEEVTTRLLMSYNDEKYNPLNLDVTVQDSGLIDNQCVVLEIYEDGWNKTGKSASTNSYLQPASSRNNLSNNVPNVSLRPSRQTSMNSINGGKVPGICGLGNLGNTCFMNSVIQCLSNTPTLTEYFLTDKHLNELNVTNPLGMRGEIAEAYGDLIHCIWSGRFSCTNPINFKLQVSKFNAQFYGCQQHDAQELLTFLLDGLHEDLNRIIKKPYIENKDYTGQEDHVIAKETWDNYKKRNDSIIVDSFHGLLKSRVVCPQCERLSVTFDPFCSLSLPLPLKKDRYLKVRFIPYDSSKRECLYSRVVVPRKGLVKDLCKEVASKTGTNASLLVAAEINNSHFHKFYSQEESLDIIDDKDIIYIYEMTEEFNDPSYMIVPVCFWELCQLNERFSQTHLFGVPFLIILPKNNLGSEKMTSEIISHMMRHFNLPDEATYFNEVNNTTNSNRSFVPNLYLLDSGVITSNNPIKLEFDENGECLSNLTDLLDVNDPDRVFGRKILIVQLTVEERQEYFSELSPDYGADNNSARTYSRERGKLQIYDCLDLFTTCEKLGVENAWYCPTCKKHQRATKKFDLWKLPKILIIHLKRFSFARFGDKIDTLVDFPINNLNLYKYVINPEQQQISYDLIGVINHYGTMTGGHYTSYCKNKDSNSWFYFDDNSVSQAKTDEIMSSTAYVLFYYRNDSSSPVDTPMDIN